MKKEIPELQRLELNKQNVMKILFDCKVTEQNPNTIITSFYSKKSTRKAPPILFDYNKLVQNSSLIIFLLGQLKIVHNQQDTMTVGEGIVNYKNQKWTDDTRTLLALYYLATADSILPRLIDGKENAITPDLLAYYDAGLFPTYSPDDPNFKLKDAKESLACLGVKLPDDLSQFD